MPFLKSAPGQEASRAGTDVATVDLPALLRDHVTPFDSLDTNGEDTLAATFDSFADAKVLLIGDASHGTSEFYTARAALTRYMVMRHGFRIVAIEADWPDVEAVDRWVRRRPGPGPRGSVEPVGLAREDGTEPAFMRFPTWMWRNLEMRAFVEWLRAFNKGVDTHEAVGIYGLDLYSLATSMEAVIRYLDEVDPGMAGAARRKYEALLLWAEEPQEYGFEALQPGFKTYEKEVLSMLKKLLAKRLEYSAATCNGDEFHGAEQNARLVTDAEHYYKAMYYGRDDSWNLRDTHMFQTLSRVLAHRGEGSKAVIWAHNSHIGDARATSMGWSRRELNVGQLCKQEFGSAGALAVGCLTHTGTVAAADHWDGDMRVMQVRPGLQGSYEELLHAVGLSNFTLDLREGSCDAKVREELMKRRLERFIGVIYRPDTERHSHYSSAVLPKQFDGLVWFDRSRHVATLEVHQPPTTMDPGETWPFGL